MVRVALFSKDKEKAITLRKKGREYGINNQAQWLKHSLLDIRTVMGMHKVYKFAN